MFTIYLGLSVIKGTCVILARFCGPMIREEIVHVNGIPKKVAVFLHGYQDEAAHIDRKTEALQTLDNFALHIPQAPFLNEVDKAKRQWYSMHQFDPDDKRRITASWDEFIEFYNRMTVGLTEANFFILQYVDSLLGEYNLEYDDVFLCGFSQGAMCAIYSGLMCPQKLGGVVSFSGILAARGYLENHSCSRPDFLLLHGNSDNMVRFEALDFTAQNLREMGCVVETTVIDGAGHKITDEAVLAARNFILTRI